MSRPAKGGKAPKSQVMRLRPDEALLILRRISGMPEARELAMRLARFVRKTWPKLPEEIILVPRLACPLCGHPLAVTGGRGWWYLGCTREGCGFQGRTRVAPRIDREVVQLLIEIEREIRATIPGGGTDPTGKRKSRPKPQPGDIARGFRLD